MFDSLNFYSSFQELLFWGLEIHKYQDQILAFLDDIKEKVMSWLPAFSRTPDLKKRNLENCLQIEDLPVEMMVEIFSYLNKYEKIKISMVNHRWFDIARKKIKTLAIRWPEPNNFSYVVRRLLGWPQEKYQDFQNLIVRFPRLKNLELATEITNKDPILPLDSFENEFDGTMEFEISSDLIQTKNAVFTYIERIKINPAKEKDFFEYKEDKIMNFKIDVTPFNGQWPNCDSVIEEVRSLDNVSKIEYSEGFQHENLFFVKLIRGILSRPYLKQIIFHLWSVNSLYVEEIDEELPKNLNVEEITFDLFRKRHSFKFYKKVLDALPNIKKVIIFNDNDWENLPVFLQNISSLKHLKYLKVAICTNTEENFDAHKFIREIGDCYNVIKNHFPMNSEVVIADQIRDLFTTLNLTNLIEKKGGEIVKLPILDLFK